MSARLTSRLAVPWETDLLDDSTWEVPDRLSSEAWMIEAGLDGRRAFGSPDDPEDDR